MSDQTNIKEVEINGVVYVEKGAAAQKPMRLDDYVIVRTKDAGVFAGVVEERGEGQKCCTIQHCRRLWYWKGAASLSELAIHGVKNPGECKFSVETDDHVVNGVIEFIPCTVKAYDSIAEVPQWRA